MNNEFSLEREKNKNNKKYKRAWLYGKTVVITGAGSGFGKLLCQKLIARYNCTVIAIGRTQSKLTALKNELETAGFCGKLSYKAFDAGAEQNWIDFANELVRENINIDILINNAGVLPPFSSFEKSAADSLTQAFNCNFFSQAYAVKHLFPLLKSSRAGGKRFAGAIINVSSSASLACVAGTAEYTASKSASASFTKILALENPELYVGLMLPGFSSTGIFRGQKAVSAKESSLIAKVCSSPNKITDKMLKGFIKAKKCMVIGADAHAMNFFGKLMPRLTDKIIKLVLKKSGLQIFSDVFDNNCKKA